MARNVDLPHPDGPETVTYSPRPMSTVTSDSARVSSSPSPLNVLVTPSSRISGKSELIAVSTLDVVSVLLRRHHDIVWIPPRLFRPTDC